MTTGGGGGDIAATMALLWRQPASGPRRGPQPRLDVDGIIATAVRLADADGLAALSMRRVAAELGVGAMSLYTHVPGKDELVALMHDAVLGELYASPLTGSWRERLTAVARANWDLFVRHPWAAHVGTGRPVLGPNLMAKYDAELAAVDGLGLSEVEMELVVMTVTGFVRGTVTGLHEKSAAERDSGLTELEWWQATEPHIERVFDAQRYPTAARVGPVSGPELGAYPADRAFEFGLERVLDGIAALVGR
ncbi:TetR/AcrR family transcriptional regulator [Blastococcus sp. SYSU D00813]